MDAQQQYIMQQGQRMQNPRMVKCFLIYFIF